MRGNKIALIGNPNVGKSTLFNLLTGLRQKIGNYPGMTVEKKTGFFTLGNTQYELTDLPGTYGIYASSLDEQVVTDILNDSEHPQHPSIGIVVGEPGNLKRTILLFQQVRDLGIPAFLVINMMDEAQKQGIKIDVPKLEEKLGAKIVLTDARNKKGIEELKECLHQFQDNTHTKYAVPKEFSSAVEQTKLCTSCQNDYQAWQCLCQKDIKKLKPEERQAIDQIISEHKIIPRRMQVREILNRYAEIDKILDETVTKKESNAVQRTEQLDKLLIHPIWGYVIFFTLLILIFQAIFAWAEPFMESIENFFSWLTKTTSGLLPAGPISDLITDGVIAGIGGIVVFIPQIAILFLFISIMEESGYMSRVVYLMDRWLRPFGLSGKSAVPLMSGAACAVPAVMSARNIENDKERLITILVTPFMTCSARLPIYVIIISLIIPDTKIFGFIKLQGMVLLLLYVLGVVTALGSAWVLKKIIKSKFKSYLIQELPKYKVPIWKNTAHTVWEKTSGFVFDAGKIILAMSIVLWVMGSFGLSSNYKNAETIVSQQHTDLQGEDLDNAVKAYQLEHSMLGSLGRIIEPAIEPLGYDWKMGVGLISSFAAREVFVATMATVYSLGDNDDDLTIRQRMAKEINANTGKPAYNLASGISLLLFYAFAMQCMSTIAIVQKEVGNWRWTIIQFLFMTGLAYITALIAYQFLK